MYAHAEPLPEEYLPFRCSQYDISNLMPWIERVRTTEQYFLVSSIQPEVKNRSTINGAWISNATSQTRYDYPQKRCPSQPRFLENRRVSTTTEHYQKMMLALRLKAEPYSHVSQSDLSSMASCTALVNSTSTRNIRPHGSTVPFDVCCVETWSYSVRCRTKAGLSHRV